MAAAGPGGFPMPALPGCACMPNGVPGLRMNAIRRPSGDHVGLVSRSTPGAMYVTVRLLRS